MGHGLDESLSRSLPDRDPGPPADPAPAATTLCTVREMAREFGTTPRALRFYESKGLLSPQRHGAVRLYGRIERERLTLVLRAKRLGFTLREIHRMLGSEHGEFGALSITRRQCFDQIKLLETRKREIEAALAELRQTYSSFYVRVAAGAG